MAKSTQSLQADPIYDQLAKLILMWRWRGKLGRTEASRNGLAEMVRQELRTRLIHDICAPSLRPLAIVRREQVAKPGLRRVLTSRQRLNASAWSRSSCARRRKAPTGCEPVGAPGFEAAKLASLLDLKGQHGEAQELLQDLDHQAVAPGASKPLASS